MSAKIEASTPNAALCRRVRARLSTAGPLVPSQVATHLDGCAACAAFARRLDLARQILAEPASPPWAAAVPDANFAARVAMRIERPSELLGWAAFRALPAALGLAVALAFLGFTTSSPPTPPVATVASAAPPQLLLDEPSPDQIVALSSATAEAAQ